MRTQDQIRTKYLHGYKRQPNYLMVFDAVTPEDSSRKLRLRINGPTATERVIVEFLSDTTPLRRMHMMYSTLDSLCDGIVDDFSTLHENPALLAQLIAVFTTRLDAQEKLTRSLDAVWA